MTVESNYAIAITKLSDWFKNLAPVYQPVRRKKKNQSRLARAIFPRALSKLHEIARNLDWFIGLLAPAVIGGSNHFGICFTTLSLGKSVTLVNKWDR